MKKIILGMILAMIIMANGALAQTSPGYSDFHIVSTIYEPYPAEPGKYIDLYIKVENRGTRAATDATFELLPKYPFSLDTEADAVKNYGRLEPKQPVLLKYKIRVDKNAVQGNNSIDLRYRTEKDGLWFTISFDIYVKSQDTILSIEDVRTTPEEIPIGGKAQVDITLKNIAETQIRDITVKLDLSSTTTPFAPIGSATEKRIDKLERGDETTVSFDIISEATADPKAYKIPISLTYKDQAGTSYTKSDIIGLLISSEPELELYTEESDKFQAGTKGSLVFSISNTGATQAKFVTITLEESENYDILSPRIIYIGNLDSDDFDTADFTIYTKESLSGTEIPLTITVEYKDAYNNALSRKYIQNLKIYSKEELIQIGELTQESGSSNIITLIVVAIILYLIYRRFFKRKKQE